MPEIPIQFPPLHKIINERFIPIFHNTDRYLLLYGSRGSSKSNFAAKKKIFECLTFPYFRDILIRDTYSTIKDSQYQTIKDIIHEWGLQPLFEFKLQPLEIICKNGNMFYARGCDDVDKIKSIKDPTGAWYEEANTIKKEDWLTITTSIRTSKAKYLQEVLSFNPECDGEPDDFWIYNTFLKDKPLNFSSELQIELKSGLMVKTPYTVHHSTYHDNRWISNEFIAQIEKLKDIDPYFYDVYALGLWGQKKNERPFFVQFNPDKHISSAPVYDPRKELIISMDFNLEPFAVIFGHLYRDQAGEHLHIFDEAEIPHGSIEAMAELIRTRYLHSLPNCKITGDSMGSRRDISQRDNASLYKQLIRLLPGVRESQLKLPPNPTHENSKADCNYILSQFADFKVHPSCTSLIRDFKGLQVDAYGSIIKQNRKIITQKGDHADSFRYLCGTFLYDWIEKHSKGLHRRKS